MADNTFIKPSPVLMDSCHFARRRSSVSTAKRRASVASYGTQPPTAELGMRRHSTFKGTSLAFMAQPWLRRSSIQRRKSEDQRITTKYLNTYRLEPEPDQKFSENRVKSIAANVLKDYLENVTYSAAVCGALACKIAEIIKDRVKDLNIPRYKIVCQVIITEEKGQGMEAASRCVWNETTDNYACASYKNSFINAIAMIHGVYLE